MLAFHSSWPNTILIVVDLLLLKECGLAILRDHVRLLILLFKVATFDVLMLLL